MSDVGVGTHITVTEKAIKRAERDEQLLVMAGVKQPDINAEGRKDDTGKLPYDLIAPEFLAGTAEILAFGAAKYTKTYWSSLWDAVNPIAIDLYIASAFVGRITKSSSGELILSSQNASVRTEEIGSAEILIKSPLWLDVEKKIQQLGFGIVKPSAELGFDENTVSQSNKQTSSYKEAAKFAEAKGTFILITTTRTGNSEAYCAVSTTTAWASLAITLKALKPHSRISDLKSETGARNWEKGMAWSRPFSALMRHMWAWWAGEKLDPETGKSHLWHACCCLMFLVAYEQRSTGTDDRPNSA